MKKTARNAPSDPVISFAPFVLILSSRRHFLRVASCLFLAAFGVDPFSLANR
ncbi:MAG: hypothetical protein BIFFINMI_03725 [Phycisphaerae bacterium]|nr:hypothetical protein [Phycisphaerae bacterium]